MPIDHLCYMQPLKPKKSKAKRPRTINETVINCDEDPDFEEQTASSALKYIFYDFECIQETGIHVPNLCIAYIVCSICWENPIGEGCSFCGDQRRHVFEGRETLSLFCRWLFNGDHQKSICIAHNAQAYDLMFVRQFVHREGIKIENLIMNGAKIMSMEVCSLKFIDSLNFIPLPLSRFPKTFGISELKKGYFPHFFNTWANQDYIGKIPDASFYGPDSMTETQRADFFKWYAQQQDVTFDFRQEIIAYCDSDVDILTKCCGAFRNLFLQATGLEPFEKPITIASACNQVFRTKFLEPKTIGIVPPGGYRVKEKQSIRARQWLAWVEHEQQIPLQTVDHGGEFKIGPYRVDGIHGQTVYEFKGCVFHACPAHFPNDSTRSPLTGLSMREIRDRDLKREQFIRDHGYEMITKWECEFLQEIRESTPLQIFLASLDLQEPLEPRDAFFGGRTNATCLYREVQEDEKIFYADITSLYPWTNKYKRYPIGHPQIITRDFQALTSYEGLVKCTILPPTRLFHPVLPYRAQGKLMFPLCRICAETLNQTDCCHSDHERQMTGTWVIFEVLKALELGYEIQTIYEIWHYPETAEYDPLTKSGGLFTGYIDTFLQIKQEASGWPKDCVSPQDQEAYIRNYYEKEGVLLGKDRIEKNEGLRTLSKLMLNSFWGKFGQRSNMPRTKHLMSPSEYFELLQDASLIIRDINYVGNSDDSILVQYVKKAEFEESLPNTNVVLAAYTTAHARLKLYSYLEPLQKSVLYYDTDSIIYVYAPGRHRIPLGEFLGDMKDELDGDSIQTFVSGGPKNYAYLTKGGSTCTKIRGITLNHRACKILNFDTLKKMVSNHDFNSTVSVYNPHKISRRKDTIITLPEKKDYRLVYSKRRILGNGYDTVPYGYQLYDNERESVF